MRTRVAGSFLIWTLVVTAIPVSAAARAVQAFEPGERLEYVLKWSGIAAGDSVMEIVEGDYVEGAFLYQVVSTARSRSLVDIMYKVRNRYETHIHPSDSLTRKYVFDMKEGGKKEQRFLLFDQENLTVTRIFKRKKSVQTRDYAIPPHTHDNLSALYSLRNERLQVGDSVNYRVFESKKNWELVIDIIRAEEITVKAGRFKTVVVHPKLKFEGIFRRKGELHVYMTDDQWHIPVLMKSKVRIGSIDAELVRFSLGGEGKDVPSLLPPDEDH